MCGRFTVEESATSIADSFNATALPAESNVKAPNWNAGPGQRILALDSMNGERRLRALLWGFHHPTGGLIINARLETLTEKPTFRPLVDHHRCLIPVSGWFEWERTSESKHPWYHTGTATPTLLLAALWRPEQEVDTTIILTQPSLPSISHIHHRMPVIIPKQEADAWLAHTAFSAPPQLVVNNDISAIPVSARVNKIANNSPENIRQVAPPLRQPFLFD